MNNIVFFDLDKTIVRGYSLKYLIKYLYDKKEINFFYLVLAYLWFSLYKFNLVNSPKKVMEKSFLFINGWTEKKMKNILNNFFEEIIKNKINTNVEIRIKKHISKGDLIYIISNSITPLVDIIGKSLGILNVLSTDLELLDGVYTGKLMGEIMYGENKKKKSLEVINSNKHNKVFVYSDHYSDLPIFELADNKIAVNPDSKLNKIAIANNWEIIKS